MACEAGLKPEEFWAMSNRELFAVIEGHRRNEVEAWKRARLGAYYTYAVNVKNPKGIIDFMPLGEDVQTIGDYEEHKAETKRLNELADKMWNNGKR